MSPFFIFCCVTIFFGSILGFIICVILFGGRDPYEAERWAEQRHRELCDTIEYHARERHLHVTDARQINNNYLSINKDEPGWGEVSKTPKRGRPKRS